jgi:general secretion pathway protein J
MVEVLVAIAVFAIFSSIGYTALLQLLDNRNRIDAERAFWRDISTGFVRIRQDLLMARGRPVRASDGEEQSPPFRGHDTSVAAEEPRFEFTRGGVVAATGNGSDLQRVGYRLEEGKLLRMSWPVLDRAPTTTPVVSTLLRDIEEFDVSYCADGQAHTCGAIWPPGPNVVDALPAAVELTLKIKDRGEFKRKFMLGREQ